MFRSQEERETARRERDAADAQEQLQREQQQRAETEAGEQAQSAASPVGMASVAKQNGETFFEIQLDVGAHVGSASLGMTRGQRQIGSSDHVLGEIEKVGWRLEHTGYYFMLTGETSTAQFLGSGQNTAVSGTTVGVYLFRNTGQPG